MIKFTNILIMLTILVLASISCGISALPPENPSKTTVQNVTNAKKPPTTAILPTGTPYDTPERKLPVSGCWNIRSTSSLGKVTTDDNIIGQVCGGTVTVTGNMVHGWLQIGEGWICNQAVGGVEECE